MLPKPVSEWTREDYEQAALDYANRLRQAHQLGSQLAAAERQAKLEYERAEQEKQRADKAEEELKRLRAVLAQLQAQGPAPGTES